jgi:hypothetical protein
MKYVPSYLMPKIAPPSGASYTQDDNEGSSKLGHIPFRKNSRHHKISKNNHFTHKVFII